MLAQCAIVRIMKREKKLKQNELVVKVKAELTRFVASTEMIIRSIQLAVQKDNIAIDKEDKELYLYIE